MSSAVMSPLLMIQISIKIDSLAYHYRGYWYSSLLAMPFQLCIQFLVVC